MGIPVYFIPYYFSGVTVISAGGTPAAALASFPPAPQRLCANTHLCAFT